MNLKTLWGALCDCFVPRSNVGGGVLGNVYGRPATALCAPDFANAVSITRSGQTTNFTTPKDGWVSVYSNSTGTSQTIAGVQGEGYWRGLVNVWSEGRNASVFSFVEKGKNITIHSAGATEVLLYLVPVKGA